MSLYSHQIEVHVVFLLLEFSLCACVFFALVYCSAGQSEYAGQQPVSSPPSSLVRVYTQIDRGEMVTRRKLKKEIAKKTLQLIKIMYVIYKKNYFSHFAALHLLIRLFSCISQREQVTISANIQDSHPSVGAATAAAEFLNYKMFSNSEDEEETTPRRRRGAESNPNHAHLRTLVQFFVESEVR